MILPPHRRTPPAKYQQPTDFARQVLDRLPLAHASLALFAYRATTPFLADLFQRHRGRCYADGGTSPRLVDWIFDALIEHHGSGRQAHLRRHRQQHDACTAWTSSSSTVFQTSMGFVLSNVVQVLHGYVVAKQKPTVEDVSTEQFCTDWHRQLVALKELVSVPMIVSLIPSDLTAESLATLSDELLGTMWKPGWDKTRNKSPRANGHAAKQKGAPTSVRRRRQAQKSKVAT